MISIRREKTTDPAAIRRVLDGAFGRSLESAAVDGLRRRAAVVLSLVALRAETIIGHVMFSEARLDAQAAPAWLEDESAKPKAAAPTGAARPVTRPIRPAGRNEPDTQWLSLEEEFAREQREREMAEVAEAAAAAARAAARKSLLESTTRLRTITAGVTTAPKWVAIGPIGVLPNQQHHGIGTMLVESGLDHLARVSCEAVFALGTPGFFGLMGFVPTRRFGIAWELPVGAEKFQVRELKPQALAEVKGVIRLEPELRTLTKA